MTETLQVESELAAMVALYRERHPWKVLEVGVWYGGTLKQWLANAREKTFIVAIDLHHPNRDVYPNWGLPGTTLQMLEGNSTDQAIVEATRRFGPYDWVFIDGDHSLEGVTADVENYLPMIAPGGVLLMHDICAPDPCGDDPLYPPGKVFSTLANRYRSDVFVSEELSDVSHGIGVIFVD